MATVVTIPSPQGDQEFVRKSIKYVLPNDAVDSFIQLIEPTLPVSPFTLPSGEVVTSQVNNSSYFDDEYLNQYKERVVKNENAELYRVRWYGDSIEPVENLFIERKRHHNYKRTGKYSNKKRLDLPKEEMSRFLLGTPVELLNPSKAKLAEEIQTVMMHNKPKIRTQYLRTSFMSQDNKDLRVTLDRDIKMFAEPQSWTEIAKLNGRARGECDMMPFAIVEVKVAMVQGGRPECPEWLEVALLSSGARNIKLSKYGYGCMKFFPEHAHPTPKWAPEIEAWNQLLTGNSPNTDSAAVFLSVPTLQAPPSYQSNDYDRSFVDEKFNSPSSIDKNKRTFSPFKSKLYNTGTIFHKARRHGLNRKKYGKTDGKAFMANERTFLNYIQWTCSLATFCVGLLQVVTGQQVLFVTTAIILFCDVLMAYATIIYQLRRIYFVSNIESRGGRVPLAFNEWKVISLIMSVFFIAVNAYMVILWISSPTTIL